MSYLHYLKSFYRLIKEILMMKIILAKRFPYIQELIYHDVLHKLNK